MKVLSLFDGISAGRLALVRAGVDVGTYYRSEIDKHADKVAMHHYPDDVQLGDVTKWREWDIDWSIIDLLIGGSPCQGFSFAGKQAGTKAVLDGQEIIVTDRETYLDLKAKGAEFLSQSYLFWEYVLCLDHVKLHNPNVKFLLENVKMKKELLKMIDGAISVESTVINSCLVSAQNRHRHYWANCDITQPEDKGILLKDILQYSFEDILNQFDSDLFSSRKIAMNRINKCDNSAIKVGNINPSGRGMNGNVFHVDGKSPTLTTNKGEGIKITGGAIRGRYNEDGSTSQRLEINDTGRTNALTTVQKDNVVVYCLNDTKSTGISELDRILKQNSKTDTLTSAHAPKVALNGDLENLIYRKLTPTECARLQTFPDGWCESVISNSQSYKAYGNSWTVDVIAHIFKCMFKK